MKLRHFLLLSLVLLMAALICTACAEPAPVYVTGAEKDKVLAAATPFTQDVLDGLQKKDYALFSKDFNDKMAKNFPVASFTKMSDYFSTNYGAFKSIELTDVQIVQTYYQVDYKLTFAKSTLKMGILLPEDDLTHLSGLWFE